MYITTGNAKYNIEVSCDTNEGPEFVQWLNEQGHNAKLGRSTANYVNGTSDMWDVDASEIMRELWEEYCNK